MRSLLTLVLLGVMVVGCEPKVKPIPEPKTDPWNEPCADKASLLATTAGSPSYMTCPNKLHRMRVQVATTSSNEEIGALVFCECERVAP